MELIIDASGYELANQKYIVKELCAIKIYHDKKVQTIESSYYLFKPPLDICDEGLVKESLNYKGYNHGIPWDTGYTPYELHEYILKVLIEKARVIYILGTIKKTWLANILPEIELPIVHLPKMRFFSFHTLNDYSTIACPRKCHHQVPSLSSSYACAFETAQRVKQWLLEFWGSTASYEKSIEFFYNIGLRQMHEKDIACLDEKFLLRVAPQQIKFIYDKLPNHLKKIQSIKELQWCKEHYKPEDGPDQDYCHGWTWILKKNCYECRRLR